MDLTYLDHFHGAMYVLVLAGSIFGGIILSLLLVCLIVTIILSGDLFI